MTTIFLCYETNPKTGLSEVKEVNTNKVFVATFLETETRTAKRVEEWKINFHSTASPKVKEFYSIEDFEERK